MKKISANEVSEARKLALGKIKVYLGADDIEGQFSHLNGRYHSPEKFLVTWIGNYRDMPVEYKIEKTDEVFKSMSGKVCVYGVANLFMEKEISSYSTFERCLLEIGLKLCPNRKEKAKFHADYAVPYNNRLNEAKKAKEEK